MISRTLPAIALALLPFKAIGQEMPRYDVDKYCRDLAGYGGTYSASLDKSCFQDEQEAYTALKPHWPQIPEEIRKYCRDLAEYAGDANYSILKSCVEDEGDAADANADRQFKY